ncbi:MAG TPA: hypothetical protein DDW36_00545 [Candidatus Magasanikbacteria bacterium]|nr:hypothetical protein [Candidatus Magasanikbacteria bacterium]
MKPFLILLLLSSALITLGVGCLKANNNQRATPALPIAAEPTSARAFSFVQTEYDFGVVQQSGGKVSQNFAFIYNGKNPIIITGVPTSCACTSAMVNKTRLAPGDSGIVTVTLNPNLHAEPEGRFYKTVSLLTEPALEIMPELKIWAEIDLDLGPDAYELQQQKHNDEDSGEDESEIEEELQARGQVGFIEFDVKTVTTKNKSTLSAELGEDLNALSLDTSKINVLMVLNNHSINLGMFDYASLATLDGAPAERWRPLSDAVGGHHITGILTFGKKATPKMMTIIGLPVGDAVLPLKPL